VRARIAAEAAAKGTRISAQPVAATGVTPRAAKAVAAVLAIGRAGAELAAAQALLGAVNDGVLEATGTRLRESGRRCHGGAVDDGRDGGRSDKQGCGGPQGHQTALHARSFLSWGTANQIGIGREGESPKPVGRRFERTRDAQSG
jgi:hypothetical protein